MGGGHWEASITLASLALAVPRHHHGQMPLLCLTAVRMMMWQTGSVAAAPVAHDRILPRISVALSLGLDRADAGAASGSTTSSASESTGKSPLAVPLAVAFEWRRQPGAMPVPVTWPGAASWAACLPPWLWQAHWQWLVAQPGPGSGNKCPLAMALRVTASGRQLPRLPVPVVAEVES